MEKSTTEKYWYFSIYSINFSYFLLLYAFYYPRGHAEVKKVSLYSLKRRGVNSKYHNLQVKIGEIYIYNSLYNLHFYKFLNKISTFYNNISPKILHLQTNLLSTILQYFCSIFLHSTLPTPLISYKVFVFCYLLNEWVIALGTKEDTCIYHIYILCLQVIIQ